MDKKHFFAAVNDLRASIVNECTATFGHKELDRIVKIVVGDSEMNSENPNLEEDFADSIVNFIKQMKQQKENEKLATRAKSILDKIKSEIEAE